MYAVVSSGGKQYRVEAGDTLEIDKLAVEPGAAVVFDRVLLVGDGDTITVGTPLVDGATVRATALGEALGPKLVVFKFKQKVKYRRRTGHRQHLTRVRIDAIAGAGGESRAEAAARPAKAAKPAKAVKAEGAAKPKAAAKPKEAASTAKPAARKPRTAAPTAVKAAPTRATTRKAAPKKKAAAEK